MADVGSYEAITHLAQLLERVKHGERFTITMHGKPVAELVAVSRRSAEDVHSDFVHVHGHRAESTHGPLTVEKLATLLLEDVALTMRRPGWWEGANMATVLGSRGYVVD